MKMKSSATEWELHRIVRNFRSKVYETAKITLIISVTNTCSEGWASAVKHKNFLRGVEDDLNHYL